MDALDERCVGRIHTDAAFRPRFANPYAVIHRADVHRSLLESVMATGRVEIVTSTPVVKVEQTDVDVTVIDAKGRRHQGLALIGADGVKSVVRQQLWVMKRVCQAMWCTAPWLSEKISPLICAGMLPPSG